MGILQVDFATRPVDGGAWVGTACATGWQARPENRRLRELIRDQIGAMVNDVIAESRPRIKAMPSVNCSAEDEARTAGGRWIGFSEIIGGGRAGR